MIRLGIATIAAATLMSAAPTRVLATQRAPASTASPERVTKATEKLVPWADKKSQVRNFGQEHTYKKAVEALTIMGLYGSDLAGRVDEAKAGKISGNKDQDIKALIGPFCDRMNEPDMSKCADLFIAVETQNRNQVAASIASNNSLGRQLSAPNTSYFADFRRPTEQEYRAHEPTMLKGREMLELLKARQAELAGAMTAIGPAFEEWQRSLPSEPNPSDYPLMREVEDPLDPSIKRFEAVFGPDGKIQNDPKKYNDAMIAYNKELAAKMRQLAVEFPDVNAFVLKGMKGKVQNPGNPGGLQTYINRREDIADKVQGKADEVSKPKGRPGDARVPAGTAGRGARSTGARPSVSFEVGSPGVTGVTFSGQEKNVVIPKNPSGEHTDFYLTADPEKLRK